MQDENINTDIIIELIAKSLDETLTPSEQAQVDEAVQASIALRMVADGLQEFDALLKRTGMAIPEEGFPARVIMRIEAYEKSRTRTQWYLTLGMIFAGMLAALLWLVMNWGALMHLGVSLFTGALVLVPLAFALLLTLLKFVGQGPLVVYALVALVLTLAWVGVSGGFRADTAQH